ncbi:putative disease resistance protein-like [Capsicum annuum]|nr:putative disease resistance protein-like [Capsicum annuum]
MLIVPHRKKDGYLVSLYGLGQSSPHELAFEVALGPRSIIYIVSELGPSKFSVHRCMHCRLWGAGGVGQTTLAKNLNNELLKNVPSANLSFGVVVWVTVPKLPIDIRKIQPQIASRLDLQVDNEASGESIARKIYQRLKKETSFLLILDDVWEAINSDYVGVPQPEYPAISKVILTSCFLAVCKQMKTDTERNIFTLKEDESWQLFVKNAGDVANLEYIQPLPKKIAKECGGFPLAITVIGTSMRGKTRVELWEDALKSLRMSEPHKQRCLEKSLHEGILGEHDTYEQAYNRGITLIESLKDACLLEVDKMDFVMGKVVDCVKMHDVVRDVARWIASTFGDEHTSVFQAGIELNEISHIKISASVTKISLVSNKIECRPDCFTKCPKTTSLLLQDNQPLKKIPQEFFWACPALRVLNLSLTSIIKLPSSINSLCQLRALILQSCFELKELPPFANLHNFSSDQATLVKSEIPRVCKLKLYRLPDLGTLGEPQDVIKWIEDVHDLEKELGSMQESIATAKTLSNKCCPKFSLRSEISSQSQNIRDQLCRLIEMVIPYKSDIPRAIWNPSLTRWGSPQPKCASRFGVSESDTPQGTRPKYNNILGSTNHDFGQ